MLEYTTDQIPFDGDRTIWSRAPLRPLVPSALTPFSSSVIGEVVRLAWVRYYDRLGYPLPIPLNLIRNYQGRAYLNLSIMGRHDGEFAGIEPLTFRVNGQLTPVTAWQKPRLLGALKSGRNRRKMDEFLDVLDGEIGSVTQRAREWYTKVTNLRWTQAEILQVMEEIERRSVDAAMIFCGARHNLEIAYNQLLWGTEANNSLSDNLVLINNALSDLDGLIEVEIAERLLSLSLDAGQDETARAWLSAGHFQDWDESLPEGEFGKQVRQLLTDYGHRTTGEGELSHPKWWEEPTPLLSGIRACLIHHSKRPAKVPSAHSAQKLLEAVPDRRRKDAQRALHVARQTIRLQSQALNALAYMLAGTRIWALAAAREAMIDGRISAVEEIFFFELEEIKQMMTGEWNVSDLANIHATAAGRRQEYLKWRDVRPFELLVGDVQARPLTVGLTGVVGRVTGPLRRQQDPQPPRCSSAIVGAVRLDSGWAPTLPVAGGYVTARGTPVDPIVAAARIWHIPTVLGLGDQYDHLTDGAQTMVDGTHAVVEQ